MAQNPGPEVYLFYVCLRRINPLIWRRVLVRADSTLADLHHSIQIAFSWTDFHLHRFRLRKKDFAVPRIAGLADAHDARTVTLRGLHFRLNERFLYEYDFSDQWEHEVRVEKIVPLEMGGRRPWASSPFVGCQVHTEQDRSKDEHCTYHGVHGCRPRTPHRCPSPLRGMALT